MENQIVAAHSGKIELADCNEVEALDDNGNKVLTALKRNGVLSVMDPKGRELEHHKVPYGSWILAIWESSARRLEWNRERLNASVTE